MNLSFQEKSIGASLLSTLLVFGYYFARVFRDARVAQIDGDAVGRLIGAVVLLVIVEIVLHIVIGIRWRTEPKDERDVLIEVNAYRNAYVLLITGALVSMSGVIMSSLIGNSASSAMFLTPFTIANSLLFFMTLSQIAKYLTQLFYYHRGL